MRKIILILLLAISFQSFAQNDTTKYFASPDYGWNYKRVKARLAFITPNDTTQNKLIGSVASINGTMYIKSLYSWDLVASGSSSGFKSANDSGFSNGYATRARLKQHTDSISASFGNLLLSNQVFNTASPNMTTSVTTSTFSYSTSGLTVSGGDGSFSNLSKLGWYTNMENYTLTLGKFKSSVNGTGIGIGIDCGFGNVTIVKANTTTGTISISVDGSTFAYVSSSSLSFSSTDSLGVVLDVTLESARAYFVNYTTGLQISIGIDKTATGLPANRTGKPAIYSFGGTQIFGSGSQLIYSTREKKNAKLAIAGTSIEHGSSLGTSIFKRWSNLNGQFKGDLVVWSLPSNQTTDIVNALPELGILNPEFAMFCIGVNDTLNAIPYSTVIANYQTIHNYCVVNSIKDIWVSVLPATAPFTGLNAGINRMNTFLSTMNGVTAYIDANTALSSGFATLDGIHPTEAEHGLIASYVIANTNYILPFTGYANGDYLPLSAGSSYPLTYYLFSSPNKGYILKGTSLDASVENNSGVLVMGKYGDVTKAIQIDLTTGTVTGTRSILSGTGYMLDLNRTDASALVKMSYNGTSGSLIGTTGANNFTVYNAAAASMFDVTSGAMTVNNAAIGTTPLGWGSSQNTNIDFKAGSIGSFTTTDFRIHYNSYYTGSAYVARVAGAGSQYVQAAGLHRFYTMNYAAAGGTQTLVERFRIDTLGTVRILTNVASGSSTTGSLVVSGGIGAAGDVNVGGNIVATNLASGTYSPTLTNTTNLTGTPTAYQASYSRIGNIVTVSIGITLQASGAGASVLTLTLPITSTFGTQIACGTATIAENGGTNFTSGYISTASGTTATLNYKATTTGTGTANITFQYSL